MCGAYIRNKVRQRGLIDEQDKPDKEMIDIIRLANNNVVDWVSSQYKK